MATSLDFTEHYIWYSLVCNSHDVNVDQCLDEEDVTSVDIMRHVHILCPFDTA